ncbi:uncharacterized protein [Cherax quadricarinatus]|uniref:uncharacterized protein n=1 Tax=Cherax quadricarinatus TaxID=27406 RepID=UPI00387E3157
MVCVVMLAGLLVLAAMTVTTSDGGRLDHDVKSLSPVVLEERSDAPRRQERFFAIFTGTFIRSLTTTTITALSTCLSFDGSVGCLGRRKKKRSSYPELQHDKDLLLELTGSQTEVETNEEEAYPPRRGSRQLVNNRDGKILTIWYTSVSTITLTSTSYLVGTTISVSAYCVAPGVSEGCFGK